MIEKISKTGQEKTQRFFSIRERLRHEEDAFSFAASVFEQFLRRDITRDRLERKFKKESPEDFEAYLMFEFLTAVAHPNDWQRGKEEAAVYVRANYERMIQDLKDFYAKNGLKEFQDFIPAAQGERVDLALNGGIEEPKKGAEKKVGLFALNLRIDGIADFIHQFRKLLGNTVTAYVRMPNLAKLPELNAQEIAEVEKALGDFSSDEKAKREAVMKRQVEKVDYAFLARQGLIGHAMVNIWFEVDDKEKIEQIIQKIHQARESLFEKNSPTPFATRGLTSFIPGVGFAVVKADEQGIENFTDKILDVLKEKVKAWRQIGGETKAPKGKKKRYYTEEKFGMEATTFNLSHLQWLAALKKDLAAELNKIATG